MPCVQCSRIIWDQKFRRMIRSSDIHISYKYAAGQCCPIELSMLIGMIYIYCLIW